MEHVERIHPKQFTYATKFCSMSYIISYGVKFKSAIPSQAY